MEALWSIEEKLKLTTQEAVAIFMCTISLLIALCIVAYLRRARRRGLVVQEPSMDVAEPTAATWPEPPSSTRWVSVKKVLMSSVRWSEVSKWPEGRLNGSRRENVAALLVKGGTEVSMGRLSHNSTSPVWQRPILMGEKCELPRFSGLILYDERGRPIDQHFDRDSICYQEFTAPAVRTTLRDLL